jgi:AcrR family transcriptional regulator
MSGPADSRGNRTPYDAGVERGEDAGAEARSARRARRPPDTDVATRDVIIGAAIQAMFENGYHGTSVRQIADRAGMSVANVYYYFPSKHDLLFRFMDDSAQSLLAQLEDMLLRTPPDPQLRLAAAVRLFVVRHTIHQARAFVAATELRALEPEAREVVIARRNAIEATFRRIVSHGVEEGVFDVEDVGLTVRAVLDMASSVSGWYRRNGSLSGDDIAERYVELALAMVRFAPVGQAG